MASMFEQVDWLVILYWVLMVPIAAWILVKVTGFFADDFPATWVGAIRTVLLVFAVVYLTYDVSGYVVALMMQDPKIGIQMPPDYSLWKWMREPIALKWEVLGFVPFVRYLPVVNALCMGGSLQVFLWRIDFRTGLVVFVVQLILDLTAMVVLSIAICTTASLFDKEFNKPAFLRSMVETSLGSTDSRQPPEDLRRVRQRVRSAPPPKDTFWTRLDGKWASVNGRLDPMYQRLQPVTEHFPPPVQSLLNQGGWLLVFAGTLVLAGYSRKVLTRWRKVRQRSPRTRPKAD